MAKPKAPHHYEPFLERLMSYCKTADDFEYAFMRALWEFSQHDTVIEIISSRPLADGERQAVAEILSGEIRAPKGAPPVDFAQEHELREYAKVAEYRRTNGSSREDAIGETVAELHDRGVMVTEAQLGRALDKLKMEPPELRTKIDGMNENALGRLIRNARS